jgi:hypothetical protein
MGTGVIRWLQHLAALGGLPAAGRARLARLSEEVSLFPSNLLI